MLPPVPKSLTRYGAPIAIGLVRTVNTAEVLLDGTGWVVSLEDATDKTGYAALSDESGVIGEYKYIQRPLDSSGPPTGNVLHQITSAVTPLTGR
jgi:hypothetical protein